jgi:hypothetical protein
MITLSGCALLTVLIVIMRVVTLPFSRPPSKIQSGIKFSAVAIVVLVALSAGLSLSLKGPQSLYEFDPLAQFLRTWLVLPGNAAALLLPLSVAVGIASFKNMQLSWLWVFITTTITTPPSLAAALYIAFNHAGAGF